MVARGGNTDSPMSEQSPQAATEHPIQDDLDHGLTQLERINKLRKEGALTEDEFTQIKETLIQKRQQI